MTVQNDFLPFACAGGATVLSQADWLALAQVATGFQSGVLPATYLNKMGRQSSIIAAVIAQLIVAQSGQPAIDDGSTATLLANLQTAIRATAGWNIQVIGSSTTVTVPANVTRMKARVWGGGGCGASSASMPNAGGGGGAGGYAEGVFNVVPGASITATIGAGNSAGSAGGTSSFGGLASATGGAAGTAGSSGSPGTGGAGGAGSGSGCFTAGGGSGSNGTYFGTSGAVGGGAGGAPFCGSIAPPNIGSNAGTFGGTVGSGPGAGSSGTNGGALVSSNAGIIILEW